MKILISKKIEEEFDETNPYHCSHWITQNCSDYSIFPTQGKIIYKNNGYFVLNSFDEDIYICLYREIKHKNINTFDVLPKLNYFMSYGGEFKKRSINGF